MNREAARLCKAKGIPVNVADSREESTFLFPALVRRGTLTVGINTGGASPAAARWCAAGWSGAARLAGAAAALDG